MDEEPPVASLIAVHDYQGTPDLPAEFESGDYRWAIYDRKIRTLFYGPADVHIHMTVAERAGVLRHHPDYYKHGGNVLGGFVCRSKDGDFYYDPFSGTFPGTNEGVQEAQAAFAEICAALGLHCGLYDDIPDDRKVMKPPTRGDDDATSPQ